MGERRSVKQDLQKLTQLAAQQVPPLTPEQFLRREYATSTDQGIASEYGIARSSVFQLRRSFGIPAHTREELFELNPAEKQEAIRKHGIAVGKANNRISFPNGEPVKDGIERRLREGATWEQIAQDAGITVNGIKSRAQRLGISRRSR